MPETKHQLLRMIRLVAELKENNYPNSVSFAKKLGADVRNQITCTPRTIERDIEFLRKELNAPIEFDTGKNGYYLKRKTWELGLSEEMMSSTMLGAQLAHDIMPEPLKSEIRDAVRQHLADNYSEELEDAFIESLLVSTGLKATIEPETFRGVFDAWRQRQSIEFVYQTKGEAPSNRLFEPHVVSFNNGLWYTKGVCLPGGEVKVFDIHRMSDVKLTGKTFEIDKKILEDVKQNGLFSFKKLNDVKLHCDKSIAFYLREHQEARHLKISEQPDGSVIVTLPAAVPHEVIRWVLGEAGKIKILEPSSLREQVVEVARKVIERNV